MKSEEIQRYGRALCILALGIGMVVLSSCRKETDAEEGGDTVSEGIDTKITVTSYTDFSEYEGFHFLNPGDKVAVISPSSLPSKEQFDATMKGLREWGYEPEEGKYVIAEERTLEQCIEDFDWALNDPKIKAIFCVRGGYASTEVLDHYLLSEMQKAEKPIIGYSDITAYHSAWTQSGLSSVHASMASTFIDLPEDCREAERRLLAGEVPSYLAEGSEYDLPGKATGILIGGNLDTLCAVLGTEYDCTAMKEPFILFLEEVDEDYEHIHRCLTILDHQGVLDRAAGIVFGEWVDYPAECETYSGNSRGGAFRSASEMVSRQFMQDREIPVAFDFPAGHGEQNWPLLFGTEVTLTVEAGQYSLVYEVPAR